MSKRLSSDGREVAAAAELLRAHGWQIVTKVEADNWSRWIQESWDRERQLQDENQRLLWGFGSLLDRATSALAPSRPSWLRRARSWWHNMGYTEPIVNQQDQVGESE